MIMNIVAHMNVVIIKQSTAYKVLETSEFNALLHGSLLAALSLQTGAG